MIIDPTRHDPQTLLLDAGGRCLDPPTPVRYIARRLESIDVDDPAEYKPCVRPPCPPPEHREITLTFCQDPVVDLFHRIARRWP